MIKILKSIKSSESAFYCLFVHFTWSHLLFSVLWVIGFFIYFRCVLRFSVGSCLAAGSNHFRVRTERPSRKISRYRHVEVKMTDCPPLFWWNPHRLTTSQSAAPMQRHYTSPKIQSQSVFSFLYQRLHTTGSVMQQHEAC